MFVKDQLTLGNYTEAIFFAIAAVVVLIATAGLALVDSGLSRKGDALDIWISKFASGAACALGFVLVGYGVWEWQFNVALRVPHAFSSAIGTWWLGGSGFTHFAQNLDPASVPGADVYQIFGGFFLVFAFFFGALLHSAGAGRLKAASLYPLAFVIGAVVFPLISWLFWGSASPLTNRGLSDYVGVYSVYLFIGAFSIVLSWRLGRRAAIAPAEMGEPWQLGLGVMFLLFALPIIVLGCGYLVPGQGYFGISLTTSGFGIVLVNVLIAFFGGAVSGAVLSYRLHDPTWAILGPVAGYVACGAVLELAKPWEVLLLSLAGPAAALVTHRILERFGIDDPKIGPLAFGPGLFAAVTSGFVGWHAATGGFFGGQGSYAFQHAHITPGMQILGALLSVAIGVGCALVFIVIAERAGQLKISLAEQSRGADHRWAPPDEWTVENAGTGAGTKTGAGLVPR
jgi:Amt family ammonium transporter